MKMTIDEDAQKLLVTEDGQERSLSLYSDEAFGIISKWWLKLGWNQKYIYTFSWMGRPIIQLPEDMIRIQELIYRVQPDVIIETGVAHGGSLIYYASLCKMMGKGKVIGIDIDIRPHNRAALEKHELYSYLTLIEGSSIDPVIVQKVKDCVVPNQKVLVILDSCHTKEHVEAELEVYKDLVSKGSFIVATDGIMREVYNTPRGVDAWKWDNPSEAAIDFAKRDKNFEIRELKPPFNESTFVPEISHWPLAYLERV